MDDDHVRLMHYDPRWRQEFEQTRSSVLQSCQGWVVAVEHIGSTAVAGLVARPTVDLMAGVREDAAMAPASELIEGLNFRRLDPPPWAGAAIQLCKPRHPLPGEAEPTHAIFLMHVDCPAWRRAIRLRDWLRAHPEDAIRFEEAKVSRWRSGQGDRQRYHADKAIFFSHLEDQIEADEHSR